MPTDRKQKLKDHLEEKPFIIQTVGKTNDMYIITMKDDGGNSVNDLFKVSNNIKKKMP